MKFTNNSLSLYIGSIPTTLKRSNILSHFKNMGITMKINNRKSRPDKRFYVIEFESEQDGLYVLKNPAAHVVEGHTLVIESYLTGDKKLRQDKEELGRKVYIGNLPQNTEDLELKAFFQRFGKVRSAYIKKRSHKSKKNFCFGFVTFEDSEVASKVKLLKKIQFKGKKIFFKNFKSGTSTASAMKLGNKTGSGGIQEDTKATQTTQTGIEAAKTKKKNQRQHAKKDEPSLNNNNNSNLSFSHKDQETLQNKNFSNVPPTLNKYNNNISNSLYLSPLSHPIIDDDQHHYEHPSLPNNGRYKLTHLQQQQQDETRFGNEHFQRIREQFYLSPSNINRYSAGDYGPYDQAYRQFSTTALQFDDFRRGRRLRDFGYLKAKTQEYEQNGSKGSRVQSEIFSKIHENHMDCGNLRLNRGHNMKNHFKSYYLQC